ncbi:hypothetical protein [Paenibacillus sp. IHBB 10380]|uniref:hypothetical protein n=1 Tax=Paenibacillus sp. IHBB 10380 TaxID=1566358 RepID=UPI0005CFD8FD|nr:hypothetical protein [Paenibacillus sp. IHBB 10380]AJS57836.1 hypothetical protein UB51_04280 [Paenibacillus sp. IHBB 10380]
MNMKLKSILNWMFTIVICCLLTSCNLLSNGRSPDELFQLTLSGLTGSDAFTFKGETALRRNEQDKFQQHFAYEGKVKNHDELVIQSIIPIQSSRAATDQQRSAQSQNQMTSLRLTDGQWIQTSNTDTDIGMNQVLIRLNPLGQLEGINKLKKGIREEEAAARGTKVLRIELDPKDARTWLDDQLSDEMNRLRDEAISAQVSDSKLQKELDQIWGEGKEQMKTMFEQADVGTVYHLTIDRTRNLPLRLTSESKIAYKDVEGNEQRETMVSDVTFQH